MSLGNPWLTPGTPIGYDTYGQVIVVPEEGRGPFDPEAWFLPGGELPEGYEHPDDDPLQRDRKPSQESWSWRCQRCNMAGSGYSTWQQASKIASESHLATVCDLLVELTMRSVSRGSSAFDLPPGTVVASDQEQKESRIAQ